MTERMKGVVIGLVKDLEDPDGLGRIRVEFPWLSDDAVSNWARVAAPLAGPELGHFFQPEPGDEALLAFEMGDINRPYILGYLWNGDNAPPSDDPNVRIIETVSGHMLIFDDTSGSETITIEDASGNNKIVMDSNGITIESAKDVTIKGQNVNIEASAQLTAKGNPIHLNP
jgi:uncharacterized protein involved in type VI secretion and phage assembly